MFWCENFNFFNMLFLPACNLFARTVDFFQTKHLWLANVADPDVGPHAGLRMTPMDAAHDPPSVYGAPSTEEGQLPAWLGNDANAGAAASSSTQVWRQLPLRPGFVRPEDRAAVMEEPLEVWSQHVAQATASGRELVSLALTGAETQRHWRAFQA